MKIGIVLLAPIFLLIISIGTIPYSSAQLSETERLAGSPSDAGNLMVLEDLEKDVVLPTDPFGYFVKRFVEEFRLVTEFNQERKAALLLDIAQERELEIRILEERGSQIPDDLPVIQRQKVEEADRIEKALELAQDASPLERQMLKERIQESFDQAEVSDIRKKFHDLRQEEDQLRKLKLANELDTTLNSKTQVKIACLGGINTLSIADSPQPVKTLRDNCPVLKVFPEEEISRIMEVRDGS